MVTPKGLCTAARNGQSFPGQATTFTVTLPDGPSLEHNRGSIARCQ
jgi:hypothetical protein